jgi:glycine hydroxymethyltransferase
LILTNDEDLAKKINFNLFPGIQGGPLEHVIAAKAVAFLEALDPSFKTYQQQVIANTRALAESLQSEGLKIVSGGSDNHLLMVNVEPVGLTGKKSETILEQASITCNKNMIPGDKKSPFVTSGIRLGTPAVTTRGMKEEQMVEVGKIITELLLNINNEEIKEKVKIRVKELVKNYPLHTK